MDAATWWLLQAQARASPRTSATTTPATAAPPARAALHTSGGATSPAGAAAPLAGVPTQPLPLAAFASLLAAQQSAGAFPLLPQLPGMPIPPPALVRAVGTHAPVAGASPLFAASAAVARAAAAAAAAATVTHAAPLGAVPGKGVASAAPFFPFASTAAAAAAAAAAAGAAAAGGRTAGAPVSARAIDPSARVPTPPTAGTRGGGSAALAVPMCTRCARSQAVYRKDGVKSLCKACYNRDLRKRHQLRKATCTMCQSCTTSGKWYMTRHRGEEHNLCQRCYSAISRKKKIRRWRRDRLRA